MTDVLLGVVLLAWLAAMALLGSWIVNTYIDGPFDTRSDRNWLGRINKENP